MNPDRGSARPLLKRCEANRPGHHRHQPETPERLEVHEKKTGHQDRGHHTRTGRRARARTGTGHRAATRRTERRRGRQPTATARRPRRTRRTNVSARRRRDRTARRRRHGAGSDQTDARTEPEPKVPNRAQGREIQPRSIDPPRARRARRHETGQQRPLTPSGHGHRPARVDCRATTTRRRPGRPTGRPSRRPRGRQPAPAADPGRREDAGDRGRQQRASTAARRPATRRRRIEPAGEGADRLHRAPRTMTPTRTGTVTSGPNADDARRLPEPEARPFPEVVPARSPFPAYGAGPCRPRPRLAWCRRGPSAGACAGWGSSDPRAGRAVRRAARYPSRICAPFAARYRAMTVTLGEPRARAAGRTRAGLLERRLVGVAAARSLVSWTRSRRARVGRSRSHRGDRRPAPRKAGPGSRRGPGSGRGRRSASEPGPSLRRPRAPRCRPPVRSSRATGAAVGGACRLPAPVPGAARAVGHRDRSS